MNSQSPTELAVSTVHRQDTTIVLEATNFVGYLPRRFGFPKRPPSLLKFNFKVAATVTEKKVAQNDPTAILAHQKTGRRKRTAREFFLPILQPTKTSTRGTTSLFR